MIVNKDDFFTIVKTFDINPFYNARGYFEKKECQYPEVHFWLNDKENAKIGCWLISKRIPILNLQVAYINSFSLNNPSVKEQIAFFLELKNAYDIVCLVDDNPYSIEMEVALRKVGFRKPLSQFGTNLTIVLNLTKELKYNRNWNRNVANRDENLVFSLAEENDYAGLLAKVSQVSKENMKIKHLSYFYSQQDLSILLADKSFKLFIASYSNVVIAARVVYIHHKFAYDVLAANGEKTREIRGVTNAFMDYIFKHLKDNAVESFDFSRLPLGRKGAEGVCEFKEGSKGDYCLYNGEWIATKKNWYRLLVYLFFKFIKRKYEY